MRRTIYAFICAPVFAAFSPTDAFSQIISKSDLIVLGVKICKSTKDDALRLKCFDNLAQRQGESKTEQTEDDGPQISRSVWNIKDSKSPIDDTPQVTAVLQSTAGNNLLIARCKEKSSELIFKPEGYLGSSGPIRVIIRINEQKAFNAQWSPSTSGQAAFVPHAIAFLKSLPDGGTLFLRASSFNGEGRDASFNLGDISSVRLAVSKACHWK